MFYEGKIRTVQMDDSGKPHRVLLSYVIDGCNDCGEAFSKLKDAVSVFGEDVSCIKCCPISEVINGRDAGDSLYVSTFEFTHINEKTGKEPHPRSRYACWASTVDDATKKFNQFAESCLADICVVSVKRSKYNDII